MKPSTETLQGKVMTVLGPISAEEMGITLPHEHLLCVHQGPLVDIVDPDLVAEELSLFKRAGGTTLVDMTTVGIGRDPSVLKRISQRTGVNVVMGTGFYKDAWLPPEVHEMSVDEMTRFMVKDITEGVDGTGIRAGVIGEVGVSRPLTPTEERSLTASAHAQPLEFAISAAEGRPNHVHLYEENHWPPGLLAPEKSSDWPLIARLLRESGFNGSGAVPLPAEGDVEAGARKSAQFLRRLFSDAPD